MPDIRKLHAASRRSRGRATSSPRRTACVVYRQTIGASALRPGTLQNDGWKRRRAASRSGCTCRAGSCDHNARDIETNEPSAIARGNILAWEQLLTDRLDGRPIAIEVRMDRQSILYTTLWLFAGAFAAAVLLLGALIWLTISEGRRRRARSRLGRLSVAAHLLRRSAARSSPRARRSRWRASAPASDRRCCSRRPSASRGRAPR